MENWRFIPKTDINEYLIDDFNLRIKSYKSKLNFDANLHYFNDLYCDLYYFLKYRDSYIKISLHFKLKPHNLDCLDALIDYFITKENIILSPIAEMSLNFIIQSTDINIKVPFLWGSQKQRIGKVTCEINSILLKPDSKDKLIKLIGFRSSLISKVFMRNFNDTKNFLISQSDREIEKLEKLLSLNLLSDIQMYDDLTSLECKVSSNFKLANKRKTDFIKIISAMYDARMFETSDGFIASNKQALLNEFGKILDENFGAYSTILSQAKNVEKDSFMKPFKEISRKAEDYYNLKNEN
jgi:hypothetical protein